MEPARSTPTGLPIVHPQPTASPQTSGGGGGSSAEAEAANLANVANLLFDGSEQTRFYATFQRAFETISGVREATPNVRIIEEIVEGKVSRKIVVLPPARFLAYIKSRWQEVAYMIDDRTRPQLESMTRRLLETMMHQDHGVMQRLIHQPALAKNLLFYTQLLGGAKLSDGVQDKSAIDILVDTIAIPIVRRLAIKLACQNISNLDKDYTLGGLEVRNQTEQQCRAVPREVREEYNIFINGKDIVIPNTNTVVVFGGSRAITFEKVGEYIKITEKDSNQQETVMYAEAHPEAHKPSVHADDPYEVYDYLPHTPTAREIEQKIHALTEQHPELKVQQIFANRHGIVFVGEMPDQKKVTLWTAPSEAPGETTFKRLLPDQARKVERTEDHSIYFNPQSGSINNELCTM